MWYNDISNVTRYEAAAYVAEYFDLKYPVARAVVEACRAAEAHGLKGESHSPPLASDDLCNLVHDAWEDGITRKDRVTVILEDSEGACIEGHCVPSYEESCPDCGSKEIARMVSAHFHDEYAKEWADHDQTIAGASWECDGSDFAYSVFMNYPTLLDDLAKEGYSVDASAMTLLDSAE